MRDRLLIAVGAVIALLVTVWLVRSEGERFRKSMHDTARDAVGESAKEAIDHTGEAVEGIVDTAADKAGDLMDQAAGIPGRVIGDLEGELSPPTESSDENVDVSKGNDQVATNEPAAPSVDPHDSSLPPATEQTTETSPPTNSIPEKKERPGKPTQDLITDIFKFGQQATQAIDEVGQEVLGLDLEEELELGKEVHLAVRREHKLNSSISTKNRLQRLAQPFLERCTRRGIQYHFFVIQDDEVNAFSHLGGYIYINTGLLSLCKSDAEIQFVLAHEIAHVDLKHCVKLLTYAKRSAEVGGELGSNLAQLAYFAVSMGYSEEYEFEADAWAHRRLLQIGKTGDESFAFMQRLLDHQKSRVPREQPKNEAEETAVEVGVREIQNHFRSHPPTEERIDRLKKIPPANKGD
jgi:hypothetical protein